MQRGRLGGQVSLRGAGRILVAVVLAHLAVTGSWGQLTGGTISGTASDLINNPKARQIYLGEKFKM